MIALKKKDKERFIFSFVMGLEDICYILKKHGPTSNTLSIYVPYNLTNEICLIIRIDQHITTETKFDYHINVVLDKSIRKYYIAISDILEHSFDSLSREHQFLKTDNPCHVCPNRRTCGGYIKSQIDSKWERQCTIPEKELEKQPNFKANNLISLIKNYPTFNKPLEDFVNDIVENFIKKEVNSI